MADDQMVGRRLRADLERIQAPAPRLDQLFERARRRRRRRLAAAWAVGGLVVVALGVPLLPLSPPRGAGPASPATTPTPSGAPPSAQRPALPPGPVRLGLAGRPTGRRGDPGTQGMDLQDRRGGARGAHGAACPWHRVHPVRRGLRADRGDPGAAQGRRTAVGPGVQEPRDPLRVPSAAGEAQPGTALRPVRMCR